MRKIWKKTVAATMMAATLISMTGCTVSVRYERSESRTLPEKRSSVEGKWAASASINELAELTGSDESNKSGEEETLPEETSAMAVEDPFVIPMPPQNQ